MRTQEAPRRRRSGMTLVEIMVSLILLGIVSGVLMRVIMRQQRFYQGVNQILTQRGQLRNATTVLPVDLRSLSSVGADILVASDSSMEVMVNVGTGVVCQVVNGAKVAMPPEALASGQSITSWYGYGVPDPKNKPKSAYTVYIYNDSVTLGNADDRWQKFTLVDVVPDKTVCLTKYVTIADAGKDRFILELKSSDASDPVTGGPLSQYIGVGAPVRIMKLVRYKLYLESDGQWYLGYSDYNAGLSKYDDLAPVSGPYDAYASGSGTATGLGFRYYDVDGNEIASGADSASRSKIARVDLIARARTSSNVKAAGIQGGLNQQYKDSLAVSVMLRNRN